MAYSFKNSKGQTYFLHATTRVLKSGKKQHLYYFAKTQKAGSLDLIPAGYMVAESKTGLPVLKKKFNFAITGKPTTGEYHKPWQ